MSGLRLAALRASLAQGAQIIEHANAQLDVAAAGRVVDALVGCRGRRFFTGVGKSGLAAARMASSLTSVGLASQWVHGAEWAHGELGAVGDGDVLVCVSHSGTTAELLQLSDHLVSRGDDVALVALTGDAGSPLARRSALALACAAPAALEASGLLPTASQLAAHHVFNALLCECVAQLELTPQAIARNHPGGRVGVHARAQEPAT